MRWPFRRRKAKFVNLDGKVQVKKVNSVQWVDANFRTTLDKGDQIQTSADGAARITFADGTTYTVKSGTFITVEENSMGREKPSSSGVRIDVGQVDLRTPSWASPGSKAAVSVETPWRKCIRTATRPSRRTRTISKTRS